MLITLYIALSALSAFFLVKETYLLAHPMVESERPAFYLIVRPLLVSYRLLLTCLLILLLASAGRRLSGR